MKTTQKIQAGAEAEKFPGRCKETSDDVDEEWKKNDNSRHIQMGVRAICGY